MTGSSALVSGNVGVRLPFKNGFLVGDLSNLAAVRLCGSRCGACGIALLGVRHRCENCSSRDLRTETFSANGVVHTFTIQRYAPPEPHDQPLPWVPRPIAWIDLDDGPRIMGAVLCAPEAISIGMAVRLSCQVGWLTDNGSEVICYGFVPGQVDLELAV